METRIDHTSSLAADASFRLPATAVHAVDKLFDGSAISAGKRQEVLTEILGQADVILGSLSQSKCSGEVLELLGGIQATTLKRLFVVSAITDACLQKRGKFAGISSLDKLDFCDAKDRKERVKESESVARFYTEFRNSFYPRGSAASFSETVCAAAETLYETRLKNYRKTHDSEAQTPPSFSRDRSSFMTVLALLNAKVKPAEVIAAANRAATKEPVSPEALPDFGEFPKFELAERRLLPRRVITHPTYAKKIRYSQ